MAPDRAVVHCITQFVCTRVWAKEDFDNIRVGRGSFGEETLWFLEALLDRLRWQMYIEMVNRRKIFAAIIHLESYLGPVGWAIHVGRGASDSHVTKWAYTMCVVLKYNNWTSTAIPYSVKHLLCVRPSMCLLSAVQSLHAPDAVRQFEIKHWVKADVLLDRLIDSEQKVASIWDQIKCIGVRSNKKKTKWEQLVNFDFFVLFPLSARRCWLPGGTQCARRQKRHKFITKQIPACVCRCLVWFN